MVRFANAKHFVNVCYFAMAFVKQIEAQSLKYLQVFNSHLEVISPLKQSKLLKSVLVVLVFALK